MKRTIAAACGFVLMVCGAGPSQAGENGYAFAAPSYYVTPPYWTYQPPVVVAPEYVPGPPVVAVAPPPVIVYEPAFVSTTVVPYDPVWPYAYGPGPGYFHERVKATPHKYRYSYRFYAPHRLFPVYKYKYEADRHGVEIEEKIR